MEDPVDNKELIEKGKFKDWLLTQVWTKQFRKHWGLTLPQYKRTEKKIRKNAKCSCGSGLKYKKCCIDKIDTNEQVR